ncbi:MAG: hypothetical protein HOO67_03110 [Candidatus Peribacteraceae bacterium]|nr:hypothetical protein [Candidatus Peribacteraceae bacterium]
MQSSSLSSFIAHARSKGMDHQTIRMLLLSAGWKEKDISQAMASETLDMAVPLPHDAGSARDAFFHLLSFTSLTATVTSLIFLCFDFLNRILPDAAFPNYYDDVSSVRWELAILVVSFPVFLWMTRLLQKEYTMHPEKLASGVRRWLTYLILFATACTLIGDLITLIFYLLQGEFTIRFLLKVAVVLIVAGLPFSYYLNALRLPPDQYAKTSLHSQYRWAGIAIVVMAMVAGLFVTGSPLRGRSERFDEQRVNDLRTIQSEILNIVWGNERAMPTPPVKELTNPLPVTLEDVAAQALYQRPNIVDPETGLPYTYTRTSDHDFRLCATFSLSRDQQYDVFWNHPVGEKCFDFDALEQAK